MISVIIPTYNRNEILRWTLSELNRQTLSPQLYEVIVVNDGGEAPDLDEYKYDLRYIEQANSGPATARNRGADEGRYDLLLFLGDDCIPDRNLLFRLAYNHKRDGRKKAVQGYTQWHPDVNGEFQEFLHFSGIQANYNGLKDKEGNWLYEVDPGYCLTTCYSIHADLFHNIRFGKQYEAAAWDDIYFGYRARQQGIPVVFDPGAVVYHHHRYDLESYMGRQQTEGYWRVQLCLDYPEIAEHLVSPEGLRDTENVDLGELAHWARQLDYAEPDSDINELKYGRWKRALETASFVGLRKGLRERHPALRFAFHAQNPQAIIILFHAVAALEREDYAYAQHCIGWMQGKEQGWHVYAFAGEISRACGDKEMARFYFQESLKTEPNKWAQERLYG